jgi:hypothetical protein
LEKKFFKFVDAAGNVDLIKKFDSVDISYADLLSVAIENHQNDFVNFFISKKSFSIHTKECLVADIKGDNMDLLYILAQFEINLNKTILLSFLPGHSTSHTGNLLSLHF